MLIKTCKYFLPLIVFLVFFILGLLLVNDSVDLRELIIGIIIAIFGIVGLFIQYCIICKKFI
jgi:hypothetical protein